MGTPFTRTLRSIRSDGFRLANAGALAAAALLALWGVWFVRARVDVVETCPGARVAVQSSFFSIDAPVGGTVAATRLELGRAVHAGDVLIELDATALELAAAEQRERAAAARAELAALEEQRRREQRAASEAGSVAEAVGGEERLQRAERDLALELAREEVTRLEKLERDGIVSELDLVRAQGVVRNCELALELQGASEERRARQDELAAAERDARVGGLERELERQRGLLAAAEAQLARLTHEIG